VLGVVVWRDVRGLATLVRLRPRNDFVLLDMLPNRVGLHTRPLLASPCPLLSAVIRSLPLCLSAFFTVCATDQDQRQLQPIVLRCLLEQSSGRLVLLRLTTALFRDKKSPGDLAPHRSSRETTPRSPVLAAEASQRPSLPPAYPRPTARSCGHAVVQWAIQGFSSLLPLCPPPLRLCVILPPRWVACCKPVIIIYSSCCSLHHAENPHCLCRQSQSHPFVFLKPSPFAHKPPVARWEPCDSTRLLVLNLPKHQLISDPHNASAFSRHPIIATHVPRARSTSSA